MLGILGYHLIKVCCVISYECVLLCHIVSVCVVVLYLISACCYILSVFVVLYLISVCCIKLLTDAEATLLAQLQHSPGHTDWSRWDDWLWGCSEWWDQDHTHTHTHTHMHSRQTNSKPLPTLVGQAEQSCARGCSDVLFFSLFFFFSFFFLLWFFCKGCIKM